MFCDPFQLAFAKRVELASLQTATLLTLLASYGYPAKHLKVSALVVYIPSTCNKTIENRLMWVE